MTTIMQHLNQAESYSNEKLEALTNSFSEYETDAICAVTVGSFARREATSQSDLDYFVITEDKKLGEEALGKFPDFLDQNDIKSPSEGGAFGGIASQDDFINNVGGNNDDNESLTRRLLFLMESECLVGNAAYLDLQNQLIDIYVKENISEHQICRFLLNDLIRYYRTICVDFEFKTHEQSKSWGDRNIKLCFSRKLMFFSGLLTVARTAQSTGASKKEVLLGYFNQTPIERIKEICGERANNALLLYSEFIGSMGNDEIREMIDKTSSNRDAHCEKFRTLKNSGQHFTWTLSKLLTDTFDEAHPIHLALKF